MNIGQFFADAVLNGGLAIAIPLAMVAGLVSFASPCILPLVPGYLAYVSGLSNPGDSRNRRRLVLGVLLFIGGFSAVFVAYGAAFGALGQWLAQWQDLLIRVLGVVVILMGVVLLGRFGPLQRTLRLPIRPPVGLGGAYDTFSGGRFFDRDSLEPFTLRLDDFEATYDIDLETRDPKPRDYTATLTTSDGEQGLLRVNSPLSIGGAQVYLLANGFAPVVTVRDGNGDIAFSGPVPFLVTDANLTSVGVIKVPDALPEQLGLLGFFYPTAAPLDSGAFTSISPEPILPLLTLNLFTGDLGLDSGTRQSAYSLDTDDMVQRTGTGTDADPVILTIGQTVDLPDGLGSITFEDIRRFIGVDISHDPTQTPILVFSILAIAGIVLGLFIPRRRVWAKEIPEQPGRIEVAALARGDDPELAAALRRIADIVRQPSDREPSR